MNEQVVQMLCAFDMGSKLVALPKFELNSFLQAIDKHRVKQLFAMQMFTFDENLTSISPLHFTWSLHWWRFWLSIRL